MTLFIKTDAFTRCEHVADEIGMRLPLALGVMTTIWKKSQTLRKTHATKAQLATWGQLLPDEVDAFIAAATEVHFLDVETVDNYRIVGNDTEVGRITTLSARQKAKALKRWAKETTVHAPGNAESMPVAMPGASRGQCPSYALELELEPEKTQKKKKHISETPSALGRAVDKSLVLDAALHMADTQHEAKPTGVKVWEAYRTSYRARYGVDPVRNAKVNRNCLDLVKRLGLESAVEVVGFYLRHNDQNYTRKAHTLGLCLYDAEALNTQMLTGKQVTATQSRQIDQTQSNKNAAQGAMEILAGRKGGILELGE